MNPSRSADLGSISESARLRDSALAHLRELRVALVHDWLITLGGADRVLLALHELFPEAPVHVSLFDPSRLPEEFHRLKIHPSWLQRIPRATKHHRWLVPVMPVVFHTMNVDGAQVIISSSHACAKGVRKPKGAVHICYCHTPMRYAWEFEPGYLDALPAALRPAARTAMLGLRWWDRANSDGVDHFIANSKFVAGRIRRHYGREATVIYPPVETEYFTPSGRPGGSYLVVSRLVPYKRVDLAVEAFNRIGRPLVVVGDGPEASKLRAKARPNITFVGEVPDAELRAHYRRCAALIFPGEEDFGLVPLEAQACGRPVVAFGRGGALESVVDGMSGGFFFEPTADALMAAVRAFDQTSYDPAAIRTHAEQFSRQRFLQQIGAFVESVMTDANAQTRKRAIPA